jgi:hypothetical protein
MARYEHIKIFQCAYILTLDLYMITKNFNREFKYTLGEKIKIAAHELLDEIRTVNSLPDREKLENFSKIDFKKENLRIYLRLAYDSKAIGTGQLKTTNEKIEEVGRQLGGWQKWTAKQIELAV